MKTNSLSISRLQRLCLNLGCLCLACKSGKWHLAQTQIEGILRVFNGQ